MVDADAGRHLATMLEPPLSPIEIRILGALAEKAALTPDVYPLSIAGLLAACNQSTSREPVVSYDEHQATPAIVSLRRRNLLRAIQPAGARVTKYQHLLDEALDLDPREIALLSVLMLRGEQTIAELFTRTARLAAFSDHADVERCLEALAARSPQALAHRLPRRPGQKEQRYAHLFSGPPNREVPPPSPDDVPAVAASVAPPDRVATLEREVADLRSELETLRAAFDAFRAQFG